MPLDLDPSRGPVDHLIHMEYAQRQGGLDPVDRERYEELIEVLHKMSNADQGRLTEGLFTLAVVMNSPGAARALRGIRLPNRRREIVALIEMYPEDPKVAEQTDDDRRMFGPRDPSPSYNLPLVLAETSDPVEIKLLAKSSLFQRSDGSRTADDIVFCTNAIEALSTIHSPVAQEALLIALASETDAIFNAARQAIQRNCTDQTRALCHELLALPKRDAIRRLVQMEGKGGFAAFQQVLFHSSRYDRFFTAAQSLVQP